MNPYVGREMVFFEDAIKELVELYRKRLEEQDELVAAEWALWVGSVAAVEFYDDGFVLLIDNDGEEA